MSRHEASIVHAYGVVASEVAERVEVIGLDGAPVVTRVVGPLRVLLSVLDSERYGEDVWVEHGQDPSWLRDIARSHHAVLQAWSEVTDVLPFRLPSLHAGEAGLRRAMEARLPQLTSALAAIRGQCEWGLKVFLEPRAEPPSERLGKSRGAPPRTGREYLVGRSRAGAAREEGRRRREAALQEVHRAFASHTTRAVLNAPQDPALSGRGAPMLLNAAYRAPRSDRERILTLAGQWTSRVQPLGLRAELTGPWPPYHFALVGESSAGVQDDQPRQP
jgi:Gas vesicle synthesis protein GvpL/GvpF